MFGALAEFESDLIRERTQAGLTVARVRDALAVETLYREGQLSVQPIAAKLQIAKSTLYAYLRHRGVAIGALQPLLLPSPVPSRSHPSSAPPARRTGTARAAGHA
jgi:hypothetical protein